MDEEEERWRRGRRRRDTQVTKGRRNTKLEPFCFKLQTRRMPVCLKCVLIYCQTNRSDPGWEQHWKVSARSVLSTTKDHVCCIQWTITRQTRTNATAILFEIKIHSYTNPISQSFRVFLLDIMKLEKPIIQIANIQMSLK